MNITGIVPNELSVADWSDFKDMHTLFVAAEQRGKLLELVQGISMQHLILHGEFTEVEAQQYILETMNTDINAVRAAALQVLLQGFQYFVNKHDGEVVFAMNGSDVGCTLSSIHFRCITLLG